MKQQPVKHQSCNMYDNPYFYNNVYGHALALLREHKGGHTDGAIHLDLGCGFGRIAEPLSVELGVRYVGVDANEDGLSSLRSRGFEVNKVWLGEEEATYEALLKVAGTRPVASISMLDTLEHLVDGDAVLRAISRLANERSALVVVSVPNVAHNDIGLKLAFGRWDYTESGLLDHTHVRLFGSDLLDRALSQAGLYVVASNDVRIVESDQHFPPGHAALARGTLLRSYLTGLRKGIDDTGEVNQFVRLCAASRPVPGETYIRQRVVASAPFLSVVIRTQGTRPHTLDEVLTALAGQSDPDFEALVIGHRLTPERQKAVERAIEDTPEWLRVKCRLMLVDAGNRTRPLNVGFAAALGQYVGILDDDDIPLGHWVATFRSLDEQMPGRMLRAVAVRQEVCNVTIDGKLGLRSTGALQKVYPSDFDFLAHLRVNHSPPVSVAFPSSIFQDLGVTFDEALTTTEDWDYIMRVAPIVGVASSPEITSIYRWWDREESSRTVHSRDEWARNHRKIFEKMDNSLILFPIGTSARLRYLLDRYDTSNGEDPAQDVRSNGETPAQDASLERLHLLQEVVGILHSNSWRMASPLRFCSRLLLGRPRSDYSRIWEYEANQLREIADFLRQSSSWRITAPLRRLRD